MPIAVALALLALSAGYAVLRTLRLNKGAAALGLAGPAGLATTSIVAAWAGLARVPGPLPGCILLALGVLGLALLVRDRAGLARAMRAFSGDHRGAAVLLLAAVLIPSISMGVAFAGVIAPLSPHDGAFHVETSDAFRASTASTTWYPPGLACQAPATRGSATAVCWPYSPVSICLAISEPGAVALRKI